MALALLYLALALVAFIGATVVAVAVMLRVQAKRGTHKKTAVDEATVAMLRRRRQRLDRRLGIDPDTDPEAQPVPGAELEARPQPDAEPAAKLEPALEAEATPPPGNEVTGAGDDPVGAARP